MATLTLDRVLTDAEALPADEQEMLESLLRQRRIEAWRQETAAAAKTAIKSFRAGKLKSQSAENIIARLRHGK
jgi:CHASE3 domain sensor protein